MNVDLPNFFIIKKLISTVDNEYETHISRLVNVIDLIRHNIINKASLENYSKENDELLKKTNELYTLIKDKFSDQ